MSREFKMTNIAGLLLLLVLMLLLVLNGLYQLRHSHQQLDHIVSIHNRKIELATEMQISGLRRQNHLHSMLQVDDPFVQDELFMAMNSEAYMVGSKRNELRSIGMDHDELELFEKQSQLIEEVVVAQELVIALLMSGAVAEAKDMMVNTLAPLQLKNNHTFQQMRDLQTTITNEATRAAHRSYQNTLMFTTVVGLSGLVLGVFVSVVTYRRTLNHTQRLRDDLNDLENSVCELAVRAKRDPLTNLPNRVAMLDYLADLCAEGTTGGRGFSLLFLDLDNFKPVNDRLGHTAGDELLKLVALRIDRLLRSEDLLARFGGDEFVIVLRLGTAQHKCNDIAIKIIDALRQPFSLSGGEVQIGVSIGIARYPQHGSDVVALLRCADEAMYCAKRSGAVGYCHYDEAKLEMQPLNGCAVS